MSTRICRCPASVTPYISSSWFRYTDLVGAFPVSMRDSVDGATPSSAAASSSLYPPESRSLRSSVPSRRRRTVGPVATGGPPPSKPPAHAELGIADRPMHVVSRDGPDTQHDTRKVASMKSHAG